MELSKTMIVVSVLALAAVVVGYSLLLGGSGKYDNFAKCISSSGAKMYGAFWCPHCNEQKAMFGDSWKYINYVECSNPDYTQKEVCRQANITGYPAWEFGNHTKQYGAMSFEELSRATGCAITVK